MDHIEIGREQALFFFHEYSPGSAFMLPHGTRIYNRILNFMKVECLKSGYTEVITPNISKKELWCSGPWKYYKEDTFVIYDGDEENVLKPMNCPYHCLVYYHTVYSQKDLPLRVSDFGVLHRNELASTLIGLKRVRRFQQDDAHIFCAPEMLQQEIENCLNFLDYVYEVFGFKYNLVLCTRPEPGFQGDIATWNQAEEMLEKVLDKFGKPWKISPGDAPIYGPSVEVFIEGATHQCGTIQLDFNLPRYFNLKYAVNNDHEARPVIIHRAICGSIERMMATLIDHTKGKWPFWLSPRQCIIVSVGESNASYAMQVYERLHGAGYYVDHNIYNENVEVKLQQARLYSYVLVVGDAEEGSQTFSVHKQGEGHCHHMNIDEILTEFAQLSSHFQ